MSGGPEARMSGCPEARRPGGPEARKPGSPEDESARRAHRCDSGVPFVVPATPRCVWPADRSLWPWASRAGRASSADVTHPSAHEANDAPRQRDHAHRRAAGPEIRPPRASGRRDEVTARPAHANEMSAHVPVRTHEQARLRRVSHEVPHASREVPDDSHETPGRSRLLPHHSREPPGCSYDTSRHSYKTSRHSRKMSCHSHTSSPESHD
jgi:hypothetical protein